ncbi:MAG: hypothetical protein Pg6C_18300 [Treponemataceae bacterium]|nr:MAG: hypothetical protein Pg6C_18300 [Treponemataceae bacterium]
MSKQKLERFCCLCRDYIPGKDTKPICVTKHKYVEPFSRCKFFARKENGGCQNERRD